LTSPSYHYPGYRRDELYILGRMRYNMNPSAVSTYSPQTPAPSSPGAPLQLTIWLFVSDPVFEWTLQHHLRASTSHQLGNVLRALLRSRPTIMFPIFVLYFSRCRC